MCTDRWKDKDNFMFHIYSCLTRQFREGDNLKIKLRAIYMKSKVRLSSTIFSLLLPDSINS